MKHTPLTSNWERPVMPGIPNVRPVGRNKRVSRDDRAAIYQLMLTVSESESEIRRILGVYGIRSKPNVAYHKLRIWRKRG